MKAVAIILFLCGLLLAVRVMLFGVQRRVATRLSHRAWPLSLAAFLLAVGALLYARPAVTVAWFGAVGLTGVIAGVGAWWLVRRSAAAPSTDQDDDPRFRFQGHVARIIEPINAGADGAHSGLIGFSFDGKRYELRARWLPEGNATHKTAGRVETEVVIERVEGEVAYVEPWAVVEERL